MVTAIDALEIYVADADVETVNAAIAGASTAAELAAVKATYCDPALGGHWGELPALPQ